ncbi:MAG: tetratricopeptide repeat protein [Nitrospirae bacterium]|nr:tetratricopeptide repeat protein [Nitrospirota bacterium]
MKRVIFVVIVLLGLFAVSNIVLAEMDTEYAKALKYYNSKKYKEAIVLLDGYIKKNPNPAAYYLMGYALYKLKRFDEATQYFNEAYLIDPEFSLEKAGLIQKRPEGEAIETKPSGEQVPEQKEPVSKGEVKKPEVKKETAPSKQPAAKKEPPTVKLPIAKQEPSPAKQPQKPEAQKAAPEKKVTQPETKAVPQKVEPRKAEPQKPETKKVQPPAKMKPEDVKAMTNIAVIFTAFLAGFAGLFAGFFLIFLLIGIAFYIFNSLCLFLIAKKLNVPMPWLAWIPFVQVWIIVASAGKKWWWIFILLIPIVNIVVFTYLWMCITENLGRNKWLGLLLLVPVIGFIWMGVLAFSKGEKPEETMSTDETLTMETTTPSEEKPPEEEF